MPRETFCRFTVHPLAVRNANSLSYSSFIVPSVVDAREMNRSMSLPPASELETAVSFAYDPETATDRQHLAAHSSARLLNVIAVVYATDCVPVSTWYFVRIWFTYSSGVTDEIVAGRVAKAPVFASYLPLGRAEAQSAPRLF